MSARQGTRSVQFTYTVKGKGFFPDDMLRYDKATFSCQADEIEASKNIGEFRTVLIIGERMPTLARWDSFGWSVMDCNKVTTTTTKVWERKF